MRNPMIFGLYASFEVSDTQGLTRTQDIAAQGLEQLVQ